MSKPRLLIVDDSHISRRTIGRMLNQFDYELFYASSGEEAIERFETILPDVVLLDVVMPDMDGFEVCRYLKSKPEWQYIPIILLTALSSDNDLVEGLAAGADDFLPKPINGKVLRAFITSALRRKEQCDALRSTLRNREDLAAMIIHDMRNPLAAMQLNMQLLQRQIDSVVQHKYVSRILSQTRYLQNFTDDLLTIARAEEDHLVVKKVATDVVTLIRSALEDHQVSAELRHIKLVTDIPAFGPVIRLDPNLFRRVIDNLLQNAFKFTPPDSQVTVSVEFPEDDERAFILRVTDEGMGVDPSYRDRIFEKYEIGDLKEAGIQQTGIGLAFCKMVAEGHGGAIFVTDNPHKKGARFVFEI